MFVILNGRNKKIFIKYLNFCIYYKTSLNVKYIDFLIKFSFNKSQLLK